MKEDKKEVNNYEQYFLFYQIMYEALKTDNVIDGLNKSLYFIKLYLNCGDVVLHKKGDDGRYNTHTSQILLKHSVEPINRIVDMTSNLVEKKGKLQIDVNLSEEYKNILMYYIKEENNQYILSFTNIHSKIFENKGFQEQFIETLKIILKRAEMYENNTRAINIDQLSGLKNRNSYEKRIDKEVIEEGLVYGIFDLFRLKYINDNYSHALGDEYIKETSKILKKYWPEYYYESTIKETSKKISTGHCIYRVGGDEFILMTTGEDIEFTKIKASLVSEEVSFIDLGIYDNSTLGLNYGIVKHDSNSSIRDTYITADELMAEDKRKMYIKRGLERRK